MLDGPGGMDEIRPRKNRTLHRRKKRLAYELPPPSERGASSPIKRILFTVFVAVFVLIGLPFIATLLYQVKTSLPEKTLGDIDSVVTVSLYTLLFALLTIAFYLISRIIFKSLTRLTRTITEDYAEKKDRRERNWRHYMKKITRVEHQMAAGADYKVGADGELIVIKHHDKVDADSALQINEDGELISKKGKS